MPHNREYRGGGATRQEPRRLIERFYALLGQPDPDGFAALFTDDGIFEQPYAPDGFPARLEGRDAILRHVRPLDRVFDGGIRFRDLEIVATDSRELFVATLRSDATVLATGRRYANEYVAFFLIRGAAIAYYREWFNPLVVLESFGSARTLNAAFDIDK